MALALQGNHHLLSGSYVTVHRGRPLSAFPPLHLGLQGGVGLGEDGVVCERLRALLSGVVIKELDDKGLLAQVFVWTLLGRLCHRGLGPWRPLGQDVVRASRRGSWGVLQRLVEDLCWSSRLDEDGPIILNRLDSLLGRSRTALQNWVF